MKKLTPRRLALLSSAMMLGLAGTAMAQGTNMPAPAASSHEQEHIKSIASQALSRQNHALLNEAVMTNVDLLAAVENLGQNNKDAALKELTDASSQLDSLLAKDPQMKRLPVDTHVSIRDFDGGADAIKSALSSTRKSLSNGQIQSARASLEPLSSEIRISTDYIPMGSLPSEIKSARDDIQAGHNELAAHRLVAALSTMVSEEKIIPIPPLKAAADVQDAQQLIQADPVKNKDAALQLLSQAKSQLRVAKLLGYGNYHQLHHEIEQVQQKLTGKTWDEKVFDHINHLFQDAESKL